MKVITTDEKRNTFIVQKMKTNFSESRKSVDKIVLSLIPGENDLEHLDHIISNHDCSPENIYRKACSHICIPTGNNLQGKCWCPVGFVLGEDDLNCVSEKGTIIKVTEVKNEQKEETTEANNSTGIGYAIVATVITTLCLVTMVLFVLHWWKYRSIPLITGPNLSK